MKGIGDWRLTWHLTGQCCGCEADMLRQSDIWKRDYGEVYLTWSDCNEYRTVLVLTACQTMCTVKLKSVGWRMATWRKGRWRGEPPKVRLFGHGATFLLCSTLLFLHSALLPWEEAKAGRCIADWLLQTVNTSPCFSLGISIRWGAELAGCTDGPAVVHCTSTQSRRGAMDPFGYLAVLLVSPAPVELGCCNQLNPPCDFSSVPPIILRDYEALWLTSQKQQMPFNSFLHGSKLGSVQVQMHFVPFKCHFPGAPWGLFICLLLFYILMSCQCREGGEEAHWKGGKHQRSKGALQFLHQILSTVGDIYCLLEPVCPESALNIHLTVFLTWIVLGMFVLTLTESNTAAWSQWLLILGQWP